MPAIMTCIVGPVPQTTGAIPNPIDKTADGSNHASHKTILSNGYGELGAFHGYTNHVHTL